MDEILTLSEACNIRRTVGYSVLKIIRKESLEQLQRLSQFYALPDVWRTTQLRSPGDLIPPDADLLNVPVDVAKKTRE